MLNSLFTFDLDVVLFHIFIGFFQYLVIFTLGINFLKIFKESANPILIYPSGLFIFSIFIIFCLEYQFKFTSCAVFYVNFFNL